MNHDESYDLWGLYTFKEETKVAKQKELVYQNKSYGIIGEKIEGTGYCVGDLVMVKGSFNEAYVRVACFSNETNYDYPFLMGLASEDLRDYGKSNYKLLGVAVPYNFLTQELLDYHQGNVFTIKDVVRKVTLDEIRQYVPFVFKLKD